MLALAGRNQHYWPLRGESMSLNINKSYKAILDGARQGRFVTYGDVAAASNVEWRFARRPLPLQLDQLVQISHDRGWPLISAIVVNKSNLDTGKLEGESLAGFTTAVRKLGIPVNNPETFLREQQQAVFEWAKTAPDDLGIETDADEDDPGGPRFVRYFGPVLSALQSLGGKASPEQVFAWIKDILDVPDEDITGATKGGQSKFENKVGWARYYLSRAGLIDGSKRGIWALTAEGQVTTLTNAQALDVFKDVRKQFNTTGQESEDEAAPDTFGGHELFSDPERQFWFVGASWGGTDDQTARFYGEGIWQNGFHNKFTEEIQRMKPGDKIAIKASFVRKHNLPFDNRGQPVSCMRIKAIGTITENLGDGKTVKVDWEVLDPPRDWYFYTYRVTLVEADPNDEMARRLIAFAFAGARQDYDFWIKQPYFAKKYSPAQETHSLDDLFEDDALETEEEAASPSYTVDNIISDGCFLTREEIDRILARVESKRNLVLQGPPGTGKTWLAKRLAYALLGSKDPKVTRDRLRVMQFHPSLSYEDFIRGWRPSGDGQLALIDGVFLEIVEAAKAEPDRPFVLVIEEINRGNPAQIFGEVLTLLEDTKRNREEAMELAYRRAPGERVYVPRNLYVIGTMNIADRSLALVDLALRRRFAFISLEPQLNGLWREWCTGKCSLAPDVVSLIEQRMNALNEEIGQDRGLGQQYRIGHSYVTPAAALAGDARQWFVDVVRSEIVPLLEEYWFDAPEKVAATRQKLLEGL
ncbi:MULTISPECIES: AAA family ATPase [unclassified Sinorhizobium]|uniref:AAA family ATPase n=1 Tax=unclassified Sinorhizobium TaxID=2613772 RepID=UPI0024C25B71|nr:MULTISPECIES: AAA family ATPase [unclassified Sinorhizobium]MDK1377233.1 AAA family ATPase [Sinorhizobium sp. 6-70]MDK1478801.1 AAA family ATPase [Sinorhizobium sp. 6-117]